MLKRLSSRICLLLTAIFIIALSMAAMAASDSPGKAPQYSQLKELYIDTVLVDDGKASSAIVIPANGAYHQAAQQIQNEISQKTGVKVPVIDDGHPDVLVPLQQNLILLGNRSTNQALSRLYDANFALTDLKYPGVGGYELHSLHNPYGNGKNVIIVGGSDDAGVIQAANALVKVLLKCPAAKTPSVGWLLDVKLAHPPAFSPDNAAQMATWGDSKLYQSRYFGWNSVSKNMALYYMTGDEQYAREFLRLAFPDQKAKQDIAKWDGERIENKDDPLAGPYHYNATELILNWDLIEESPFFTNEQRLKITNGLARQYQHVYSGTPDSSWLRGVMFYTSPQQGILDRHRTWTALQMYTLSRYFMRDYKSTFWQDINRSTGEYYFDSISKSQIPLTGELSNWFWYCTAVAPIMDYMILSGDYRTVQKNGLQFLLDAQEVLWDGTAKDMNIGYCAYNYLTKATYLTGDGRWMFYLHRYKADLDDFRLGQSFWPDPSVKADAPDDISNKWLTMREANSPEQLFRTTSYRDAIDGSGDFLQADGIDGGGRNAYHTFAILKLRIAGTVLLDGYLNQIRTSADGTVAPKVTAQAILDHQYTLGDIAQISAHAPQSAADWQRHVLLRKRRYAIIFDRLKFDKNSHNFEAELWWEGNRFHEKNGDLQGAVGQVINADALLTVPDQTGLKQIWHDSVKAGQEKYFFSLVAANNPALQGVRLAPNAAVFQAPETIVVSTGEYDGVVAALALQSEQYFSADSFTKSPELNANNPVNIDWDYTTGKLSVMASSPTQLTVASSGRTYSLHPGTQVLDNMRPRIRNSLSAAADYLRAHPKQSVTTRANDVPAQLASLRSLQDNKFDGDILQVIWPMNNEHARYVMTANAVSKVDANGQITQQIPSTSPLQVMHWWPEAKLLLVGNKEQKVLAYDDAGNLQWTFASQMAKEVFQSGKTYWFNTARGLEGVSGLSSGTFYNNQPQLFVGSAGTLEFVDENGKLLYRKPQFWGNPVHFQLVPKSDGSIDLLTTRDVTDWPDIVVLNNRKDDEGVHLFNNVPANFTRMNSWGQETMQNLFYRDVDGDGKKDVVGGIIGAWNSIIIWDESGNAKNGIYFGGGKRPFDTNKKHIPMTLRDMDIGDIDGDGNPEIVAALSSGLIVVMDGQLNVKWSKRLSGAPLVLKIIDGRIIAAQEDGRFYILNGEQQFLATGKMDVPISAITATGKSTFAVTSGDHLSLFALP